MNSSFFNLSVLIQHDHNGMPFALGFTHELALETNRLLGKRDEEATVRAHWSICDGQWTSSDRRAVWVTCELFTETWVKAPVFTGETDRTVRALVHSQRISVVFKKDGKPILRSSDGAAFTIEQVAAAIASRTPLLSW